MYVYLPLYQQNLSKQNLGSQIESKNVKKPH